MAGHWKEVVRLRFEGERFHDRALDLSALTELSQFQRLIAETAKALWRSANADRERLPRHFEERTRLCLRNIEPGSAVTPLEVYVEDADQGDLWEAEPKEVAEVAEAIGLAHEAFAAVERDAPLPDGFPKHLIPEYAKLGQSLADDEVVEFQPPGKQSVRLSAEHRTRLTALTERPYQDAADITGEVTEADVRQRRFQMWWDGVSALPVPFAEEQEDLITGALKDHKSVRLRVVGRGEYSPTGQLLRIVQVERLEFARQDAPADGEDISAIEAMISSIVAEVPETDRDNLPPDLAHNLDHYLYGTPKK